MCWFKKGLTITFELFEQWETTRIVHTRPDKFFLKGIFLFGLSFTVCKHVFCTRTKAFRWKIPEWTFQRTKGAWTADGCVTKINETRRIDLNHGIINQILHYLVSLTLIGIYSQAVYWKPLVSKAKTNVYVRITWWKRKNPTTYLALQKSCLSTFKASRTTSNTCHSHPN